MRLALQMVIAWLSLLILMVKRLAFKDNLILF